MAGTIVDTNILLDIYTQDEVWEERSAAAIAAAADVTVLVINPIIYGELSVGIERIEELDQFLGADFRRDSLPWEAAFAHAVVERMSILTRDANRYVLYFPSVKIIEP